MPFPLAYSLQIVSCNYPKVLVGKAGMKLCNTSLAAEHSAWHLEVAYDQKKVKAKQGSGKANTEQRQSRSKG
jgi:hypothetical protein